MTNWPSLKADDPALVFGCNYSLGVFSRNFPATRGGTTLINYTDPRTLYSRVIV